MKTVTFVLFAFISNIAASYGVKENYELINFSSARIRGIDEIINETGTSKNTLKKFNCQNSKRFEVVAQNPIPNMAMDSLKIITKEDSVQTYFQGKLLDVNGNEINIIKDKFTKIVLKTIRRLESIPEARAVIELLQASPYPFYIKRGGNRYQPNNPGQRPLTHGNDAGFISMMDELRPLVDGMPFSQIGFGGFIYWNPKTKASFIEEDYILREVDKDLILAHEMYHAYDGMRGLLDRRFVKSDVHEFQPVCEYRAVRFENIIRKALGYKYRRFYSTPTDLQSPKDLLNDNNEPLVIPTPCIKWI